MEVVVKRIMDVAIAACLCLPIIAFFVFLLNQVSAW